MLYSYNHMATVCIKGLTINMKVPPDQEIMRCSVRTTGAQQCEMFYDNLNLFYKYTTDKHTLSNLKLKLTIQSMYTVVGSCLMVWQQQQQTTIKAGYFYCAI